MTLFYLAFLIVIGVILAIARGELYMLLAVSGMATVFYSTLLLAGRARKHFFIPLAVAAGAAVALGPGGQIFAAGVIAAILTLIISREDEDEETTSLPVGQAQHPRQSAPPEDQP